MSPPYFNSKNYQLLTGIISFQILNGFSDNIPNENGNGAMVQELLKNFKYFMNFWFGHFKPKAFMVEGMKNKHLTANALA